MRTVQEDDEEVELDSGSVAIRHITVVRVHGKSQQKAGVGPVVSPSLLFSGNESERSPTRSLSRSFEQDEHQREPETDRGSPSEQSSRSTSKGSKGDRARSKGNRQRWADGSDMHEGRHWQDASGSDSNDDYDRKDMRNAEGS